MKQTWITVATALLATVAFTSCSSVSSDGRLKSADLFNGRDLSGWKHVLADAAVPRDQVWTVRDGIIVCKGTPLGYLYSQRTYTNFRLEVEYRWAPGAKPGNSGLFSRINGTPRALPRCIEVQLQHQNAGDVMGLQGMKIGANQPRHFHVAKHEVAGDIDGVKKLVDAEAAPGEWNRVEVLAQGSSYTVWVNGQKVNEATQVELASGPIGLQSEGGEIHFRKVTITPL